MGRAEITVRTVTRAGEEVGANETTPDAADDAMFVNDGKTWLEARNTGAGAHVVTLVTPQELHGLPIDDVQVTVPAGETHQIGPFPTGTFNQPSGADTGKVYVNVDGTKTEMRYKALKLGN